jgi:hypothetical protein
MTMGSQKNIKVEDYTYLYRHTPTRPIKYMKDGKGDGWLCDKRIDLKRSFREQGCWRCDEMAFPDGGR